VSWLALGGMLLMLLHRIFGKQRAGSKQRSDGRNQTRCCRWLQTSVVVSFFSLYSE